MSQGHADGNAAQRLRYPQRCGPDRPQHRSRPPRFGRSWNSRSAGGAVCHCDRDLLGLATAEHGQIDSIARVEGTERRDEVLRRLDVVAVDRGDDIARPDTRRRSRTERDNLEDDGTAGAVDCQLFGDLRAQRAGLNADVRMLGSSRGQQLVCDVDDIRRCLLYTSDAADE